MKKNDQWIFTPKKFTLMLILVFCTISALMTIIFAAGGKQTAIPLGTSAAPYGYYEYLPEGYPADLDKKWPVVVFLHGSGEQGDGKTELNWVLRNGPPANIDNGTEYPFICISPQSPTWWDDSNIDKLIEFVKSKYRVDRKRIYLTGISMGGGGTWSYAVAHPEKLAAIIPVCGAGSPIMEQKLVNLPVWALHSWGDLTVSSSLSVDWCNKIAGKILKSPATNLMAGYPGKYTGLPGIGNISDKTRTASFNPKTGWSWADETSIKPDSRLILTLYQNTLHDCWSRTYAEPKMWDWLLAKKKD